MFIQDFLRPFDYVGNKGLKWVYDNVYSKYVELLNSSAKEINIDKDKKIVTELLAVAKYCELVVNDVSNPLRTHNSLEYYSAKWKFDDYQLCFTELNLDFNEWLTAMGFMPAVVPDVSPHAAVNGYFNYITPVTPVDNTYNVIIQGAIGIYLLDAL